MSTNAFRLFIITIGFIVVYGIALLANVPVEKIMLMVAFICGLNGVADDLIMRILLNQNAALVDRVIQNINKEEKNERET